MRPPSDVAFLEVGFADARDAVELRVVRGRSRDTVGKCSIDEAGLTDHGWNADREAVTLPSVMPQGLRGVASSAGRFAEHGVCWLTFAPSGSRLPLLPWESWLAPELSMPIVRLGLDVARPRPRRPWRAAIWASLPDDEQRYGLAPMCAALARGACHLLGGGSIDLFTEVSRMSEVTALVDGQVHVHKPPPQANRRAGNRVRSDWLRWMIDESDGPFDLVVVLAHGVYAQGNGLLAVATSPYLTTAGESQFVGSQQLAAALDRLGTRALAVTVVPRCYSRSGIDMLADSVARSRAGTVAVIDGTGQPPDALESLLPEAVGHVFGAPVLRPYENHGALYTSPAALGGWPHHGAASRQTVAAVQATSAARPDAWRLSEFMLQQAARIDSSEAAPDAPSRRGKERALEFLAGLLASNSSSSGATGAPPIESPTGGGGATSVEEAHSAAANVASEVDG